MAPERALASVLKDGGAEFSPRDVVAFTKLAEGISSAKTLDEVLWAVAVKVLAEPVTESDGLDVRFTIDLA